jgi:uncharacterized phage protein (TIGR02218 family)
MREFINGNGGGPAFLQSCRGGPGQKQCWVAELFTFTLLTGAVDRWTSFNRNIAVASNTWLSPIDGAPLVTRNRFSIKNTVEVPEFEIRLSCSDTLLSNLKAQVHNGLWDGARIEMDRVFMPTPGDTQYGYVLLFSGRASGAVIDAEGVTLTCKGDNVLMNQQAPRNLYQTNCLHTFCDSGCTLSESAYTFAGLTVGSGSNAGNIAWNIPGGFASTQFINGKVTMTSGTANGQIRTVRYASNISLALTYPLYDAPAAGDTFNILLGCGRQQSDCENRSPAAGGSVNNVQHFRGYPYVPPAEIAV